MGVKRVVDVELWTDELVETFTPEERYFWLFMLTNPFTTQCGIYRITKKQMGFYLGYEQDVIDKLLRRFEGDYGMIRYEDNELAIKNYMLHSIVKGGFPIEEQIKRELKRVRNVELIEWVFDNLDGKKENLTQTIINILSNKDIYINANANACTQGCTHERTQKKFIPPTLEEIEKYCKSRNSSVDPKAFYEYFTEGNWQDSNGKKVKSWKQKVITWENHSSKPKKEEIHPVYEDWDNPTFDENAYNEIMASRGENDN